MRGTIRKIVCVSVVLAGSLITLPSYAKEIDLRTSVSPPYQLLVQGKLSGVSITTLQCVFRQLDTSYRIDLVPPKRAEHEVQQGVADGYFSIIENSVADQFARLSSPLAMEKWFLVSHSKQSTPIIGTLNQSRIGAVRGSNEAYWLERYHQIQPLLVADMRALVNQLARGRIDAFIADRRHVNEVIAFWPQARPEMRLQFLRFAELGVYFGERFLSSQPNFLRTFNTALGECQELSLSLTEQEQRHLLEVTRDFMDEVIQHPIVQEALHSRRLEPLANEEIAMREQRWRDEFHSGAYQMIAQFQSEDVSRYLMATAVDQRDGFTELLLFDAAGANVGISTVTSDYDQGDEEKWSETIAKHRTDPYLSDVRYDRSTQRFQAQITQAIYDDEDKPLGALTVGLDIEYLLSGVTVPLSLVLQHEDSL